jgi:hypothetical protein
VRPVAPEDLHLRIRLGRVVPGPNVRASISPISPSRKAWKAQARGFLGSEEASAEAASQVVGQGVRMIGSEGVDHKVDVRRDARAKLWSKLAASQTSIGAAFTRMGS